MGLYGAQGTGPGLTLNVVVVNFALRKQKSFNPGQIYVALSRVTSLQGLYKWVI